MCFPQVTFDTSKHLSELALKRRSLERLKLQELERQREEQKRREKEEEERRKEEERYDGRQKENRKLVYDEQGLQRIHVTLNQGSDPQYMVLYYCFKCKKNIQEYIFSIISSG